MNRRVAASPLRLLAVFAGLVAGLLPFAVAAANPVPPTPAEDVALLAHPALLGREAGSPQAALASQYIAQRLRGLGLQPFEGDSYFQPVPLTRVSARVGAAELVVQRGDASFTAHYGKEAFVELGGVPDLGAAPLSLVFAGYGIVSATPAHDDLAGLDLKGKAVLVWNGEPQKEGGGSPFAPGRISRFTFASIKRDLLAQRGARLVLIGTPPGATSALESFRRAQRDHERPRLVVQGSPTTPPVVYLDEAATRRVLEVGGADVAALWSASGLGKYAGRDLAGLTASLSLPDLASSDVVERNVVALLPGSDMKLKNEVVIVGSHFDHIGADRQPDGSWVIYPGADDNASGVAAMLAAAEALSRGNAPKRSVLFASFAAEESGALGSAWLASHPLPAGMKPVALVNLDMVGQNHLAREDYRNVVLASFTARSTEMMAALIAGAASAKLDLRKIPYIRPSGRSDDTPFAEKKIPAVLLFTGMHPDHDTPRDTADNVITDKIAVIGAMAANVARQLADAASFSWNDAMTEAPKADNWDRPY
ncbi:MAG: M20/M25/M40 family metallo-hydrolase [Acidobacteriota bacterium]